MRSLFVEMGVLGYRRKEPNPLPFETSQLLGKVLALLRDDGIAKHEIADALSISADELNSMIFGLAPTIRRVSPGPQTRRSSVEAPVTALRVVPSDGTHLGR